MTLQDILDPQLDASFKGFPHGSPALRRSAVAAQKWNVLRGDLPLPLAVLNGNALAGNLQWMQGFAGTHGLDLAPHGKTTMSAQLFRRQLDAGAWGLTFATVGQMRAGIAAGARRCLIANQVFRAVDLQCIDEARREHSGLRVLFLVDSIDQLALIEGWHAASGGVQPFEVLLEIGVDGARTGCRTHGQALALAGRLRTSTAARLAGIACYEGLGATGITAADEAYTAALMGRVRDVAVACDAQRLFEADEVLVSAGGSAIFDLVAGHLRPNLALPVRGLLRSGCYLTQDHGFYRRMMTAVSARLGCGEGLHAALEVWACVQSCPEAGLAILSVGKRDISHDLDLPTPVTWCRSGRQAAEPAPAGWKITALNDQHAYLRTDPAQPPALRVGDLVGLGVSHPCTTFDKWRWMPIVDDQYTVCDAITTCF